jgi:hypothetical protein
MNYVINGFFVLLGCFFIWALVTAGNPVRDCEKKVCPNGGEAMYLRRHCICMTPAVNAPIDFSVAKP